MVGLQAQAVAAATSRQGAEAELSGLRLELKGQAKEFDRVSRQQALVVEHCAG